MRCFECSKCSAIFNLTSKEIYHYVKNWYWCKWKTVSLKFDATSKEKMELNIIINYILLIFYAVVACPGRGKHSNNGNIESNHTFPHIAINKQLIKLSRQNYLNLDLGVWKCFRVQKWFFEVWKCIFSTWGNSRVRLFLSTSWFIFLYH